MVSIENEEPMWGSTLKIDDLSRKGHCHIDSVGPCSPTYPTLWSQGASGGLATHVPLNRLGCLCGILCLLRFCWVVNVRGGHEAETNATLAWPILSVVGDSAVSCSSQWGSDGGPIMPNVVTVVASGNVYIADGKNYAIVKLARD